ncbi:MAG: 2-succinyl-5-enolpyruvyl-6-hydroxy-3-cyclohexene-1-carboxylic-acid synthase [Polyangiaceae bacterium]
MSSLLGAWSRLLFGSLAQVGLRDVIISPGSRSTPFAWAALNTPGLACRAVPDERSAGFFALGQARSSGQPSALLCTSGSAAAHYLPAIVEAAQAFVPLLVISADRPFELMDCGAAQAMDQSKLYGGFVRRFTDLGHPDASDAALDALTRMVAQAHAATLGPTPGPVHVNARARKPLEPQAAQSDAERALEAAVQRRLERGPVRRWHAVATPPQADWQTLLSACETATNGLIVVGPLAASGDSPAPALLDLAGVTGFAVCAESTSQVRCQETLGSLEAMFGVAPQPGPELVLQFGAPPTSASYERWAAQSDVPRAVIGAHGWLDPSNRAQWSFACGEAELARALASALREPSRAVTATRRAAREQWAANEEAHWHRVDSVLSDGDAEGLSEARAVERALSALPAGALLGLGNSLPLRDADSFVRPPQRPLRVWSQRGVNGIDGLVAGAAGAADAARCPSLLLLGDVSLLHDLGSLYVAREVATPLVLCVLDNAGGRIFDELPIRQLLDTRPELERFWQTPPQLEFEHAAKAFGIAYSRAENVKALEAALATGFARPGCTLVHAVVRPDSARQARAAIRAQRSAGHG